MLCSSARFILFQVKTQTANKLCFLTHHLSLDQQFVKIFVQWEESCSFVTLLHLNVLAKITNEFKFSAPSHLLCKFSIFWNYFLFIHMCNIYMCIYIYFFWADGFCSFFLLCFSNFSFRLFLLLFIHLNCFLPFWSLSVNLSYLQIKIKCKYACIHRAAVVKRHNFTWWYW